MNRRPRRHLCRHVRQRGSVLVLVLGVTSIVGVIGLSSLLAVRLQHRDVQSRADATQAQAFADSALQLIHTRLGEDPDWRTNHTHDTWSDDELLSRDSTLRYKLRDEDDGDLADNETDPVRLVVRVAHGEAVRLASIQLTSGVTLGPELVTNGDMEAGTTGYQATGLFSNVVADTTNPHGGTTSLRLTNRLSTTSSWKQNLPANSIESGKTYRVSAWVRLEDAADDVVLGLANTLLLLTDLEEEQAPGSTAWTEFQFDLTPTFLDLANASTVYGRSANDSQDLHLDNLSVREVLSVDLPVVRGSYRRELDN